MAADDRRGPHKFDSQPDFPCALHAAVSRSRPGCTCGTRRRKRTCTGRRHAAAMPDSTPRPPTGAARARVPQNRHHRCAKAYRGNTARRLPVPTRRFRTAALRDNLRRWRCPSWRGSSVAPCGCRADSCDRSLPDHHRCDPHDRAQTGSGKPATDRSPWRRNPPDRRTDAGRAAWRSPR